jgi:hypothetical protein
VSAGEGEGTLGGMSRYMAGGEWQTEQGVQGRSKRGREGAEGEEREGGVKRQQQTAETVNGVWMNGGCIVGGREEAANRRGSNWVTVYGELR